MAKSRTIISNGSRYGKLTIGKEAGFKLNNNGRKRYYYWASCDCGSDPFEVRDTSLSNSSQCKLCGWADARKARIIHGEATDEGRTKTYDVWNSMKQRCLNPRDKEFHNYGGRGITICQEWLEPNGVGFINFRKWFKESGYKEGLSIDRNDVNGNYCPENCSIATIEEQNNNKRTTIRVNYQGKEMSLKQAWRASGSTASYTTIRDRYQKLKLGIEECLSIPPNPSLQRFKQKVPE